MKSILRLIRTSALPVLAGSALFGLAVNMFLLPMGIVTGGATGIATAASKLWGVPVGLGILIVNLPIFIVCIKDVGISGAIYSIIGTVLTSVFADVFLFLPSATEDVLLAALIGGAVMGLGSGMLLTAGFTTGGTDLAAHLVHRRFPSVSTGRLILFLDAAIIVLSAVALKNFAGIMYSAVCAVSYSASLDMVLSTSRRARMVFVVSDMHEKIAEAVARDIDRGVTLLSGSGYYTGKNKSVIMCVVGKAEEFPLRRLVLSIDPSAFIVVGEATEAVGLRNRDLPPQT